MSQQSEDGKYLMETITSLTTEAAMLEARILTLREELAEVAARTRVVAESMSRLDHPDACGVTEPSGGSTGAGSRCGQRPRRPASHADNKAPRRGGSATRSH
ncbi:hypothetical protein ACFW5X_35260 [Streptomyces albogriseolus]|uniref:hypothetical protein n=1 Tax=Streptomyces albogriseolus TaxID=1887 RepID=UPI0036CF14F1